MLALLKQLGFNSCCPFGLPGGAQIFAFSVGVLGDRDLDIHIFFMVTHFTGELPVQPNLRSSAVKPFIFLFIYIHVSWSSGVWSLQDVFWINHGILILLLLFFFLRIKLYSFGFLQKWESWDWISKGPVQRNRCWWKHLVSLLNLHFACF